MRLPFRYENASADCSPQFPAPYAMGFFGPDFHGPVHIPFLNSTKEDRDVDIAPLGLDGQPRAQVTNQSAVELLAGLAAPVFMCCLT